MLNQQPQLNLREYRVYSEHGSKPEALSEKNGEEDIVGFNVRLGNRETEGHEAMCSLWRHVLQFLLAHVRPESQNSEGVG